MAKSKSNPSAADQASKAGRPAPINKTQGFWTETICRNQIKSHPRNPRTISAPARKKLTAGLKDLKMLGPVEVNKRTGNLVGGHQRLAVCDAIEGRDDYMLTVAYNWLTDKQELKALTLLNNGETQGDWDTDLLAGILKDLDPADRLLTGFDEVSLAAILGTEAGGMFEVAGDTDEGQSAIADLDEAQEEREKEADAAKGRRQKIRETTKKEREDLDTEKMAVVVFANRKARDAWVGTFGLPKDTRYVPASYVTGTRLK